tara:strand:+ start:598 stop:1212 length:615 start_codon:yes stop_codon:yes gene_type:complete
MKNNITRFNKLLSSIQDSIFDLANLYYEDLKENEKAETLYLEKTSFTRTMLRRLLSIAKGDLLPDAFFMVNSTAYRAVSTMSPPQQEKALHEKVEVVSEDGSHWEKKFEDLSPRQMNMVYDQRAKEFRSEDGQRDWLKSNPVVKISDGKGHIKEIVKEAPKVKETTKAKLIKELKEKGLTAQDLAKLADASTLMAAAQLALAKA